MALVLESTKKYRLSSRSFVYKCFRFFVVHGFRVYINAVFTFCGKKIERVFRSPNMKSRNHVRVRHSQFHQINRVFLTSHLDVV